MQIKQPRTLIACSGGIDSVFLLYYFSDMKKNENFNLHACYVDHKLRPESASESKFVDKICQELGIPFHFASFDNDFWKDSRQNMEERARRERYRMLNDLAVKLECEYIATGHHLDDQVETVLMRIFDRGTGIKGLAGIHRIQNLGKIKIIRPLLNMSRAEIERKMEGKEYMVDSSNRDTTLRRNHFRKNVIPAIELALKSDEFKKHIYDLSQNAQRELEFTNEMAKEFWKDLSLNPSPKGEGLETSPFFFEKRGAGGELFFIPRGTIEKYSDNFWLTAFSYLFSEYRDFSHCTNALIDIVAFIRKKEPANANYDPFVFVRNKEGVRINNSP